MIAGIAPPEIITGRLMSGAGPAPMLEAATAYGTAAAAYELAGTRYMMHLAILQQNWQGVTSMKVAAVLLRRVMWYQAAKALLVIAAGRSTTQAALFTTAYSSMVTMAEIVQNRITHDTAVATNFLGMTTPIINATEAQYISMAIRNTMIQQAYLAGTIANTTFKEKFFPSDPMTTGAFTPPQLVMQAAAAALHAADKITLALGQAEGAMGQLKAAVGMATSMAYNTSHQISSKPGQADAQAAIARLRESQATSQESAMQQSMQQLVTQIPQQVAQAGQQAAQAPQQLMQQGMQPAQQMASQMSQMMQNIKPEHQVANPGMFDTRPDSPTMDRLTGSGPGSTAMVSALRVSGLSGLSSASNGFKFPSGWDGSMAAPVNPTAPPAAPPASAAGRGGGPMMMPPRRKQRDDQEKITRPTTDLSPVWGAPEPPETISAGELARERLHDDSEEAIA
ncbi:PPE protein [Mycobacteroides abscessus subsp. abscessus]|uniref:PPE family protein n=1 Tax=Mycobacteroides abscessus TaxID=36809 RepID=UPI000926B7E7|nr:PPE family protein [Mycobacteroides abscessus]SHU64868.1 PPE protein [Mycobacteroides abscessus subsp. abscessus]